MSRRDRNGLVDALEAELRVRDAGLLLGARRARLRRLVASAEANSVAWFSHQHSALVSLAHARVDLKAHQVSVVHRVISQYPHRFMLCDEVGLGKTIEAAMIIKELRARGQAQRVLILVPSGLTRQWQFELKTKFNETFAIYTPGTVRYLGDKGVMPIGDTRQAIRMGGRGSRKRALRRHRSTRSRDPAHGRVSAHAAPRRGGRFASVSARARPVAASASATT